MAISIKEAVLSCFLILVWAMSLSFINAFPLYQPMSYQKLLFFMIGLFLALKDFQVTLFMLLFIF